MILHFAPDRCPFHEFPVIEELSSVCERFETQKFPRTRPRNPVVSSFRYRSIDLVNAAYSGAHTKVDILLLERTSGRSQRPGEKSAQEKFSKETAVFPPKRRMCLETHREERCGSAFTARLCMIAKYEEILRELRFQDKSLF